MTKKIPVFVIILCISFLNACSSIVSNESNGVPENVIMSCDEYQNFTGDFDFVEHEITHNVNTENHTDTVILKLTAQSNYATVTSVSKHIFQYHKSDDLWVLIDSFQSEYSTQLDAERFISESPWKDTHNNTDSIAHFNNEFTYEIYIDELDIFEGYITLRYNFQFTNDYFDDIVQNTAITLPLDEIFGGSAFGVEIDVSNLHTPFDSGLEIFLDEDGLSGSFRWI